MNRAMLPAPPEMAETRRNVLLILVIWMMWASDANSNCTGHS